jgi:hypothetical protein
MRLCDDGARKDQLKGLRGATTINKAKHVPSTTEALGLVCMRIAWLSRSARTGAKMSMTHFRDAAAPKAFSSSFLRTHYSLSRGFLNAMNKGGEWRRCGYHFLICRMSLFAEICETWRQLDHLKHWPIGSLKTGAAAEHFVLCPAFRVPGPAHGAPENFVC